MGRMAANPGSSITLSLRTVKTEMHQVQKVLKLRSVKTFPIKSLNL